MKTSNLFWGFFLVTIGSLFLLTRYTEFYIPWHIVWDLWPVLLILMGISIMVKGTFVKPLIGGIIGILLGFLIFGLFNDLFDVCDNYRFYHKDDDSISQKNYLHYEPEIKYVTSEIYTKAENFLKDTTEKKLI
ncbi:MAG: hypothetical protein CR986_07395 [Ignavibacteriae bacterium]|nr:MAG: hypothetical protein CR986_07395 [Ignavibacteriota bacterium]